MNTFIKLSFLGLIIFMFTGCTISAKSFVQKTEPKFNEIVNETAALSDIIDKDSVTASLKVQKTAELKAKVAVAQAELAKLQSPSSVKDLQNDLNTYYTQLSEVLTNMADLVDFADLSQKFADDFSKAGKDLPTDFNKDLTDLKKQVMDAKSRQEASLNALKSKSVPQTFVSAKDFLVQLLEAYVNFLNSLISAIDAKKIDLIKADDFSKKIDSVAKGFESAMNLLQTVVFSDQKLKDLQTLEDKIKVEFAKY